MHSESRDALRSAGASLLAALVFASVQTPLPRLECVSTPLTPLRRHPLSRLQENATRLKAYKANLAVFPRRAGKPKAGDASAEQLQTAQQLKGKLLPGSKAAAAVEKVAVTADMKVGWGWG